MPATFDTIGILARKKEAGIAATLDYLIRDLAARRRTVVTEDASLATGRSHVRTCSRERLAAECDLVLVVGGDGTLLEAGRAVAPHNTPILGINLGRLGFLVDVAPDELTSALDAVLAGNSITDSRIMLNAVLRRADGSACDKQLTAINECVVRNQAVARVLDFDTYLNDAFISQHRADGIAIATPTGSTAYALSSGGPILHPSLSALAMVPICPHTLSDRPVIVDAADRVEVLLTCDQQSPALFTNDGQVTEVLQPGDRVVIERAPFDLLLIHPPGYDYFSILRNKLHWGRSPWQPPA